MEYLLANRIFMFFSYPLLCKLFCCVTGCVTSSGHMLRSHDTKSKDTSGGMRYYYTVECFRVIPFFDLLGEECFFPPNPPSFCLLSGAFGCCYAASFLSALTFTGPGKILLLFNVNR